MSDKDDDTGIDWAEASDEQLAQAAAEFFCCALLLSKMRKPSYFCASIRQW